MGNKSSGSITCRWLLNGTMPYVGYIHRMTLNNHGKQVINELFLPWIHLFVSLWEMYMTQPLKQPLTIDNRLTLSQQNLYTSQVINIQNLYLAIYEANNENSHRASLMTILFLYKYNIMPADGRQDISRHDIETIILGIYTLNHIRVNPYRTHNMYTICLCNSHRDDITSFYNGVRVSISGHTGSVK